MSTPPAPSDEDRLHALVDGRLPPADAAAARAALGAQASAAAAWQAQRADLRDNNGNEGAIYLVHGPLEGELSAADLSVKIWGEASEDRLSAVSGGGDANEPMLVAPAAPG